jgi:hypothetical protein
MPLYYTLNLLSTDIATGTCISQYWYFTTFEKLRYHFINEIIGIRELSDDQRIEIIVDMNEFNKKKDTQWHYNVNMSRNRKKLCYIIAHDSLFQETKQKQD